MKNLITNIAIYKRKQANKKLNKKTISNKSSRWKTISEEGQYKRWRYGVLEFNKRNFGKSMHFICEKCGKKYKTGRYIHSHHVFSWHKYEDKRYDVDNGVVLCIKCHNKFHKTFGFDSLDKPELIIEYLGKKNKRIKKYVNDNLS